MRHNTQKAKRALAAILCVALSATGCATANGPRVRTAPADSQGPDRAVLVEYVQNLNPGSAVRVVRANGRAIRGTLMKATADAVIIQRRTRIPEPALEIPMTDILAVTPDKGNGSSLAKAIGAGVAAGAGAALAMFLVLVSVYD